MRALAAVLLVLLALPAAALAATPRTSLPDVEDEVMCITCGTALNISTAPAADRQRAFIRRRIAEGMTKDEVKESLISEYGPEVLAEPRQRSAWLIPVLGALLALSAVGLTLRRWRGAGEDPTLAGPEISLDDRSRLDRDMRAYE